MWSLQVRCDAGVSVVKELVGEDEGRRIVQDFTTVMKFGGSSVASAHRMKEVAQLILSFPEEKPIIVLSAMGKTTNNLLKAGDKAISCGVKNSGRIEELQVVRDLHKTTARELKLDESLITGLLDELEQLLMGIALMKELTSRTKDYLVSFGERLSTRLFAAYLNSIGTYARQVRKFLCLSGPITGCDYSACG